jgi:hypothetical protein
MSIAKTGTEIDTRTQIESKIRFIHFLRRIGVLIVFRKGIIARFRPARMIHFHQPSLFRIKVRSPGERATFDVIEYHW